MKNDPRRIEPRVRLEHIGQSQSFGAPTLVCKCGSVDGWTLWRCATGKALLTCQRCGYDADANAALDLLARQR